MATTTPNFGWPVPTSTDLVKDGATAIEALGDGIDTSLVDLKGGTTGQILAKTTSADMDFSWITNDAGDITEVTAGTGISGGGTSGAVTITNSMATEIAAKGDLIAGTGSATFDNLTAGANGETLVADSSTTTGLRYTAGNAQGNPVINSAMQVWQRGTSSAIGATGSYIPDRWICARNAGAAGGTVSRQVTNDTTNLPNIQYCARVQRDSGNSSTAAISITQVFETVNSIPYAGKTVTISFYGRAGANYSSASSALPFRLRTGTGTDQNPITVGYTGGANPVTSTATLTTTWQRFSATGTLAATATEMSFIFEETPVGTAGADDYFEVTGMQIDIGSVALPFRTYAATIQGELAAAQRYYYRQTASQVYSTFGQGSADATTANRAIVTLPVTMRVVPTSIDYSTLANFDGVTVTAVTAATLNATTQSTSRIDVTATVASGLTQFRPYTLLANNSTSAYIGFSSEL